MAEKDKPWLLRASTRWGHFRAVPFSRLWVLVAAVFLLFSVVGFYIDLNGETGEMPYAVVVMVAILSGLNAALWIFVLSRLSRLFLVLLIVLQFFIGSANRLLANWMVGAFSLQPVSSQTGIHFASTATLCATIASYVFFVVYITREGRESFRIQNELRLAHRIQATLVPPVALRSTPFEV